MTDDVKPYTPESLEPGLRDVRNGLRVGASMWDQNIAIAALHRVAATARAGLEDRERLDWLEAEARAWWERGGHLRTGNNDTAIAHSEIFNAGNLRKAIDNRRATRSGRRDTSESERKMSDEATVKAALVARRNQLFEACANIERTLPVDLPEADQIDRFEITYLRHRAKMMRDAILEARQYATNALCEPVTQRSGRGDAQKASEK